MPELGTYGSVRGVPGNGHPYRDHSHYLAPFYSHTGRPSIEPELMIRMLIVGYRHPLRAPTVRGGPVHGAILQDV